MELLNQISFLQNLRKVVESDPLLLAAYGMAVEELYYYKRGKKGDNFNTYLFDLIFKADILNTHRLGIAYPCYVRAVLEWKDAGDYGDDLFRQHGLM